MNKDLIDASTGEFIAVSSTRFYTAYNPPVEYAAEVPEGESCTDTSLYEPLQTVIERCERAQAMRSVLDGAMRQVYDSREEIADDVLDAMQFTSGDALADVNFSAQVVKDILDAQSASSDVQRIPAADADAEPTGDAEKSPSVDEEE